MSIADERLINGAKRPHDSHRYGSFSFANEDEDPYFVTHAKPGGLEVVKKLADEFIRYQVQKRRSVVLVTSGGSTVPLEV
jgi:hypothetical protein